MTVKELKEKLMKYNDTMEVRVTNGSRAEFDIYEVYSPSEDDDKSENSEVYPLNDDCDEEPGIVYLET